MSRICDEYTNAVCGTIVDVATRSWSDDGSRMVTIKCDDWFDTVIVRAFVRNWEDAEMLVDSRAIVYGHRVYAVRTDDNQ